jgi:hypothetical protein
LSQRDLEQIGNGIGAELFHDVGSVGFNGFDADAKICLFRRPATMRSSTWDSRPVSLDSRASRLAAS